MPLSPDQAGAVTRGMKMVVDSIASAIDAQLADRYDNSGSFQVQEFEYPGNDRILDEVVRLYKSAGWKGTRYSVYQNKVRMTLAVREEEVMTGRG